MEGMRRIGGMGGEVFYAPNRLQFSHIQAFWIGNYKYYVVDDTPTCKYSG